MENNSMVFIGSYAKESSPGIYSCSYDSATGDVTLLNSTTGLKNPSFLDIDKENMKLYALAFESDTPEQNGLAISYHIDPSGTLEELNREVSVPASTCHIMLDHSQKCLLVASYGGGYVGLLPLLQGGRIGKTADTHKHTGSSIHPRQEQPHPHSVFLSPDNQYALVPDLGIDKIMVYKLDLHNYKLVFHKEVHVKPGSGPRHLTFHPSLPFTYVINELNSTIDVFAYKADQGDLQQVQSISTLPESFTADNICADIHISPDGRFLYGSNRGHDSIVVYDIDQSNGLLTLVEHTSTLGEHPRNFALSLDGKFLLVANRDTNNIVSFRRDEQTGKLNPTGSVLQVSQPVCIKFL